MSTLRLKVLLDDGGGEFEQLGSTLSVAYTEKRVIRKVLNNAAGVLWDSDADGALADFDVAILYADQPVELELTTKDGDAAEELASVRLASNTPLCLGADDSFYNHSASDAFGGTLDVIDRIRAKETNSVDATIYLLLFT